MLRCVTRCLWYEFKDVKSKTLLERLVKAKVRAGASPEDVDMEELARESGLAPSNSVDVQQFVREKETVMGMLQEQRLRRIARREAFLEWQAGQREKGAAHRLLRQARKAEKYKQRHYHATSGRMVPVMPVQQETFDPVHQVSLRRGERPPDSMGSTDAQKSERLHLKLGKG